ncbi:dynein axonemal heavy chain 7-like [Tachypleus tridentatus]|uniref:dynein axonemal heavy chain 7-like n=1 Tax=Tachypleus tridentatus TaxID=6853 RepID=UPI003FD44EDE
MQKVWLEHIMSWVSPSLKLGTEILMSRIIQEIQEDYLLNVKKAIVDFVLRDPQETKETEEEIPAHREELKLVPKLWQKRFTIVRRTIKQHLHLLNPCVCGLLNLWSRDYESFHLLDIPFIMSKNEALDLSQFQQLVRKQLESSRDVLLKRWFTAVQNIIHQGIKQKHVPSPTNQLYLQSFFDNVAMLMTLQLQSLCKVSMEKYTEFLCTSKENHIFIIKLVAVGQQIKLEPTYHDFETVLLDVLDSLLHSVRIIPRVENRLNTEHTRILESKSPLQPVILEEVITSLKTQILTVLKEQFQHPQKYMNNFNKYLYILDGEAEKSLFNMLESENSFEVWRKQVYEYKSWINKFMYTADKIVDLGMFQLDFRELYESLASQTEILLEKLLNHISNEHQEESKRICDEYKQIVDKALTIPKSTQELMNSKAFIEDVKKNKLPQLKDALMECCHKISYIVEYLPLSPLEIQQNSEAFQWQAGMDEVFINHHAIIQEKDVEFQEALKVHRRMFIDELESYGFQIEELTTMGELQEVSRYLKKARKLEKHLQEAADKVDQFNMEEESFGWSTTNYPQRPQLLAKLLPYLKLYEVTVDFNKKHSAWLEGPLRAVNPDLVEQEVGNYWRIMYKLEKTFNDCPTAKKVTLQVKTKIEDFKDNLPLIQTLCNPGLRDRHWDQISDAIGFPLHADDNTTLAKIIDLSLDEFVSQFELISESASKEYSLEKPWKNDTRMG